MNSILSFILIACGCVACTGSSQPGSGLPPNIVLLYLDDLGYGDVGAYGATAIPTPHMDRLAREGLRFTSGYAAAATCTPSRYALLTGTYPWRKREARILPGSAPLLIDTATTTLPRALRAAGYRTGVVGKWHLGLGDGTINWNHRVTPGPNQVGFDYSFIMAATQDRTPTVYLENGYVVGLDPADPLSVSYRTNFPGEPTGRDHPELLKMGLTHGHDQSIVNGISRIGYQQGGRAAYWGDENMADTFLLKAKHFIAQRDHRPFFLYYALQQPHVPRTPHPRFAGATDLGPRGDVIVEADWMIGQFLGTLAQEGLLDNTLILLSSDNGPVLNDGYLDDSVKRNGDHTPAGPLRGGKYSRFEAGTRVPFITFWPGRIAPGTSDALISQVDLLSSLATLAGSTERGPDSRNLLPELLGESYGGRQSLVLSAFGKTAYRAGDWSLIPPSDGRAFMNWVGIETGNAPEWQLYDLATDPGQRHNLANERPEKLAELRAAYQAAVRE